MLLFSHGAELGMPRLELGIQMNTLAREGKPDQLGLYVAVGADVDAPDYDGRTLLHICASEGHKAVVQVLLAAGASCDKKDRWGNTAQVAAEHAKTQVSRSAEQIMGLVKAMDQGVAWVN